MSDALAALAAGATARGAAAGEASLPDAVRQFEAYFLGEMLRLATHSPLAENALGGGPSGRMYRELFYQEVARLATGQSGLGLVGEVAGAAARPGSASVDSTADAGTPKKPER